MSTSTAVVPDATSVAPGREQIHRALASIALVVAGVIHLLVVPEHLEEFLPSGVFFAVLAVAQLGLAVALQWALDVRVLVLAVVVHVGVIALYVASRTADLPFLPVHESAQHAPSHLPVAGGHGNGVPIFPGSRMEPVGLLDLSCLAAELVAVGLLVTLLPARSARLLTNLMLAMGLAGLLLRGAGVLS